MRYPDGSCDDCGERLYGSADGGTFCPNCGNYPETLADAAVTGSEETVAGGEGGEAVPETP